MPAFCLRYSWVLYIVTVKTISTPGRFLKFLIHLLESIRNQKLVKNMWKSSRKAPGTPWLPLRWKALNYLFSRAVSQWTGLSEPNSPRRRRMQTNPSVFSKQLNDSGIWPPPRSCMYNQILIHRVHRLMNQALLQGSVDIGIPPTSPWRVCSSSV